MEMRNPTEISIKCTRILSFWLKETNDDSVTVDDQCDVLCENVDVDELSMDLVSVNGSFEESVAFLSIAKFPDNVLVSIPNLKFDDHTRRLYSTATK